MVFNKLFTTIYDNNNDYNVPDNWADLFTSSRISFLDGEDDLLPLPPKWTPPVDPGPLPPTVVPVPVKRESPQNGQRQQQQLHQQIDPVAQPQHQNNQNNQNHQQIVNPLAPNHPLPPIVPPNDPPLPLLEPAPDPPNHQPQNPAPPVNDQQPAAAPQPAAEPQGPRRNPPRAAQNRPFRGRADLYSGLSAKVDPLERLNNRFLACQPEEVKKTYQMALHSVINNALFDVDNEIQTGLHPLAFAAKVNSADFPKYHKAMNSPEHDEWIKTMETELSQLEKMDCWDVVKQTDKMNIISSVWAFRKKHFPDGSVQKYKA